MQLSFSGGVGPSQLPEQVGAEQIVVAIHLAGPPLSDGADLVALEPLQHRPRILTLAERPSEIDVEERAHAGPEEEPAPVLAQVREHLGHEVIRHSVIVTPEPLDDTAGVVAGSHRQRRDPHTRSPPSRALLQGVDAGARKLQALRREVGRGLLGGAGQARAAELADPALHTQPWKADRRIAATDEHEVQAFGRRPSQPCQRADRLRVRDDVDVVEDQRERGCEGRHPVGDPVDELLGHFVR